MTQIIRQNKRVLLPFGLLAGTFIGIVSVVAVNRGSGRDVEPRQIVLVARDVAFYVDSQPDQENPDIILESGQTVRLVIRNDEPEKVLHCFTIGGLDVKTSRDLATGESETLVFTPRQTGTFTYACLMHPMMAGTIVVR